MGKYNRAVNPIERISVLFDLRRKKRMYMYGMFDIISASYDSCSFVVVG